MLPMDMDESGTAPSGDARDNTKALTIEELRKSVKDLRHRSQNQRMVYSPTTQQLLSRFTVFCLIMNRTIASGIFKQPSNVLQLTGSTASTLILFIVAGIIVNCITACWLELCLTVPSHYLLHDGVWQKKATPTSGGDKNYLEYIYKVPKYFMTCVFGIAFIVWGNLAGNAIQFGIYMNTAADPNCTGSTCYDDSRGKIIGWAVGIVTMCALINVSNRQLSIQLNNALAVIKVLFLVATFFVGIIWGSKNGPGCSNINFDSPSGHGSFGDFVQALFFAIYPYTGYEQPFYVLAEVAQPQRTFARSTVITMASTMVLFPLVNVGYLCAIPYTRNENVPDNMGTALFRSVATANGQYGDNIAVEKAINVILAIFIFGNLLAQTYTASRVKQEIAKEGVLPWSLTLSSGAPTWLARLQSGNKAKNTPSEANLDSHIEEAPIAATVLHWAIEVAWILGIGFPSSITISTAYNFLTYLYTYVIVVLLGLLTSAGLLYLKINSGLSGGKGRKWGIKSMWRPWFDPLPVVVATVTLAFLVGAAFAPTSSRTEDGLPWWAEPTTGLASITAGAVWWLGLKAVEWTSRTTLQVVRRPYVVVGPDGESVQKAEFVEHDWIPERS